MCSKGEAVTIYFPPIKLTTLGLLRQSFLMTWPFVIAKVRGRSSISRLQNLKIGVEGECSPPFMLAQALALLPTAPHPYSHINICFKLFCCILCFIYHCFDPTLVWPDSKTNFIFMGSVIWAPLCITRGEVAWLYAAFNTESFCVSCN